MRIYEKITVPEKVVEKHTKTVCDICEREAIRGDWETSTFAVGESEVRVEVRHREGVNYPEGGWGEEFVADICPECFKDILIPFLKEVGCKAETKEWER